MKHNMPEWKTYDPVAILPEVDSPAADVLEVAEVKTVNSVFIQLADGRFYSTIGGKSLLAERVTQIVPATDEHYAALNKKKAKNHDRHQPAEI